MSTIRSYWTIRQVVFVDTLEMLSHRSSPRLLLLGLWVWTVSLGSCVWFMSSTSCSSSSCVNSSSSSLSSSQFEQLHVVHWQFLDQERLTRSPGPIWRQSCLFFCHNKPFPSLPFPRLQCLLLLKKMKRHNFTNYFINFISRPKWN